MATNVHTHTHTVTHIKQQTYERKHIQNEMQAGDTETKKKRHTTTSGVEQHKVRVVCSIAAPLHTSFGSMNKLFCTG